MMIKAINKALFNAIDDSSGSPCIISVKGLTWNPETDSLEKYSFFHCFDQIVFQVDNIVEDKNSLIEVIYEFKKENLLRFFGLKKFKEIPLRQVNMVEEYRNPFSNINIWDKKSEIFKRLMNDLLYPYLYDKQTYLNRAVNGFQTLGFKEFSGYIKERYL